MSIIQRPATAFQLDAGGRKRRKRQEEPQHLAFIRTLPCLVCGVRSGIEAAHVRYGDLRYGKRNTGKAEKPDDKYAVPLCGGNGDGDHRDQHRHNERAWWESKSIDPIAVAQSLWACTGDEDAAIAVIRNAQKEPVTR